MKNNSIGTGSNFPPENPGFIWRLISYSLVNFLIVPVINIFMKVLNRTRIKGLKHISGLKLPWIMMSNHVTLLDDLFIDPLIMFPKGMLGYRYIPYHAPEEKNFYKTPLVAWFMRTTKSIPLIRGKGFHQEGINKLIAAVKNGGILHIYPEGTRTRSGKIGKGKEGIGRIVYESGAVVVPVYHRGLEKVLPIGKGIPSIFKSIDISIGKPIEFKEELEMENNIHTWRIITDKVMEGIQDQKKVLEES
ncbi:1-acyl-sn-glycerol-3-phosphate acyltransferase [bacterium]|nr:1-acyl-sn-glycerol-3-phosphate acyltransferase [bacterium]